MERATEQGEEKDDVTPSGCSCIGPRRDRSACDRSGGRAHLATRAQGVPAPSLDADQAPRRLPHPARLALPAALVGAAALQPHEPRPEADGPALEALADPPS